MSSHDLSRSYFAAVISLTWLLIHSTSENLAADRLVGLHSAQVMSQSMP